jgi:hypothetical protein
MYEAQYDAVAYALRTYYAFVFAFHITGWYLEKLLFHICKNFRLRKTVGCLSVDCMHWMYSTSVRFSSAKKSWKLIKSSKSHCSRNENKDLDFSMRTLSSKLIGSIILVVLIGGTRNLYLKCDFFSFFTASCMIMSMNFGKPWIPNDLCCMSCICPETSQSMRCFHFHRPVHPLSTTVRGHAHSLYSGIRSQNNSPIVVTKQFLVNSLTHFLFASCSCLLQLCKVEVLHPQLALLLHFAPLGFCIYDWNCVYGVPH